MEKNKEHYKLYKSGKIWLTAAILSGMVAITDVQTAQADVQTTQTNQASDSSGTQVDYSPVTDNTVYNDVAKRVQDKENVNLTDEASRNVVGLASNFGIYAKEANLSADTNSNLAVQTLNNASSQDFGTTGNNPDNLTKQDISYIQNIKDGAIKDNAFRNPNGNTVVVGQTVNVQRNNDSVRINGTQNAITNLKSQDVLQDTKTSKFIDFDKSFSDLQNTATELGKQVDSAGVVSNYSDMNNRTIDVNNAKADDQNRIFVTIPVDYLTAAQPIKISGLSSSVKGSTVIFNVTNINQWYNGISTQVNLSYTNGAQNIPNSNSHSVPNHILWNFGLTESPIGFYGGRFMGSVLAPNATVQAGVNIDGNIIAKSVNVTGEFHRWDLQSSNKIVNQGTVHIKYIDKTTGATLKTDDVSGKYNNSLTYQTQSSIDSYTKQGYSLVSDGYTGQAGDKFNKDNDGKTYPVILEHASTTVTPINPKVPGDKINPENPNSPKWPKGTDAQSLTKTVNQTVSYKYDHIDGPKAADDKTDQVVFYHSMTIDKVTGEVLRDNGWTAKDGDTTFDAKKSPVISGYTANKSQSDAISSLTHESEDNKQTIIYTKTNRIATAEVKYIDDTTGKTLSEQILSGQYNTVDSYQTKPTILNYIKNRDMTLYPIIILKQA
ncbi:collagen-binding domain-containing protein [Leuconostoc citreum]|uniref:collagen-binding domain-containing protein n=1 Tax=Leuconostoc citreum TaxID=33964 RepID=UPI00024661B5|nr:collagen-binding domain-containing protein [Leuconostoc citreum]MCS8587602.1 hypothetical protein [Leuconostoc citreum]MCS8594426.1 hypothetical protein [Leuconostoc citreum]MCS8599378.1 hypothetical protein [Leuconostoc citreum]CCF23669.1 Cell surface protein [Leuconostoc citreum LBAE C10]